MNAPESVLLGLVLAVAYSTWRTTTTVLRVFRQMERDGELDDRFSDHAGPPVLEAPPFRYDLKRCLKLAIFCVFGWLWWVCVEQWRDER